MFKNEIYPPSPAFSTFLLDWHQRLNDRQMPWKGERDPYRIWLSEIILQQTRVDQGLAYYNRFIERFPTIRDLAAAPDDEVFKLWEGLGYYSRCRNLIATAKLVATEMEGVFPSTYEGILALKGVGPYTAAAISSFGFGLPHAVVDGNVFRVLARIFGIDLATDSTAGRKYFNQLAQELLSKEEPAAWNQSIMDFGAVICKPALPLCSSCVFNEVCYAYLHHEVNRLPVKEGKIKIRKRWFYYLVMNWQGMTIIRQRTAKGIWQQLYEFPLVETDAETTVRGSDGILAIAETDGLLPANEYEVTNVSPIVKQQLSHQLISGTFIVVELKTPPVMHNNDQLVNASAMKELAFPGIINQWIEAYSH